MSKTNKEFPKELRTPLKISNKERQRAYGRLLGELMLKSDDEPLNGESLAVMEAYERAVDEKIEALARHYGLLSPISCDPRETAESYRNLLVALASDFVPAFRNDLKGGRPADKWDSYMQWLLVTDMERRIKESGSNRGISYAAAQLAKKPWWQALIGKKEEVGESSTADAIRAAYNAARKKPTDIHNRFGDLHQEKSAAEWDEYVRSEVLMKVCRLECGENWQTVFSRIIDDESLK
jgi:hypothetical protein